MSEERPCCFGDDCDGNRKVINYGYNAYPLKPTKERSCKECLYKIYNAREAYIKEYMDHYEKTGEQLIFKKGCVYCGNGGINIGIYKENNKSKARYGEYCSMGCAMMSSEDYSNI